MYYPFLRGKQNEILALKDLSSNILRNSKKVSPIIEPIKISASLKKCLPEFVKNKVNFSIIINPSKGDLIGRPQQIISLCETYLIDYDNYQIGIIINSKTNIEEISRLIDNSNCTNNISLIFYRDVDQVHNLIQNYSSNLKVVNNIVNIDNIRERFLNNFKSSTIITLKDSFISQGKNSDYLRIKESEFSQEHIIYLEDGLKGFSDFLTIGNRFVNGGFAPYAVAIHITFIYKNKIRVKHFVSDSNTDNTDVAGKFIEALNKLAEWNTMINLNTIAINQFMDFHNRQHFPGLGYIKKLSLMNHIEVISKNI